MRALAAELLRAQRENNMTAFESAMLRAQGNVPALLLSLCGLANRAMDQVISREAAMALVTRLAAEMDDPPPRDLFAHELWADAVSLLEAAGNEDGERAVEIMRSNSDLLLLHGFVMQAIALILVNVPADTRATWMTQLRGVTPPSL